MKEMLSGNEAIARGAYEYGATFAAGYPGTPSTEIMEIFAKYQGVYAEWSPNEKVALEVAIGAALGGAKAMAVMKHVGVNVAADPHFTVSYTGTNGALVVVPMILRCTALRMNRTTGIMPLPRKFPCSSPLIRQRPKSLPNSPLN